MDVEEMELEEKNLAILAENLSDIAFALRSHSSKLVELQGENKDLRAALEVVGEKNYASSKNLQQLQNSFNLQQKQLQEELNKTRQKHSQEVEKMQVEYARMESQFEDEKQQLHRYIISLEAKLRGRN